MRKRLCTGIRILFLAALTAAAAASCSDDRSAFEQPDDPIITPPDKDKDDTIIPRSLEILSGEASAYEKDSLARVYLRTVPWDLLLSDTVSLQLVNRLGAPATNAVLQNSEMLPDSTWLLRVNLADDISTKSDTVCIAVICPDTVMQSRPIVIKRVSFRMLGVKIDAKDMKYDSKSMTYHAYLPVTDFHDLRLKFNYRGDSVTFGNSTLLKTNCYSLDLSEPVRVTLWQDDLYKDYIIKASNTNLPIVTINTPDGKEITSKTVWTPGATMKIVYPDGRLDYEGRMSIRGRGNNTWTFVKKPYALRLDKRAEILGMPEHKRWILLANYKDRTLMRNDAAFWLSKQTDLPYTIRGQFVELVFNGKHVGNYYLCEQAKIDENRIDIDDPNLETPELGGIFAEMETYFEYYTDNPELGFWSKIYNLPYVLKDPDIDVISTNDPVFKYFKKFIEEMEAVLNDETRVKNHEYEKYIDVDKAIDYALINEMAQNHDFYNSWPSNGPHSFFLYIDRDRKLCFGPVWDFDYHTFMPSRAYQWEGLSISAKTSSSRAKFYYTSLLKDPKFKERLIERWEMLKYEFAGLPDYIDMMADSIRASEECNYRIWGRIQNHAGDENRDIDMTFQQSIDSMKEGFRRKWQWMDNNIRNL